MSIFLNSTSLQMQYFDNNEASKVPNCWPVQNGEGWRHTWRRGKSNPAYKSFRAAFARVNLDFKPLAFKSLGPINRVRFVVQTSGGGILSETNIFNKIRFIGKSRQRKLPPREVKFSSSAGKGQTSAGEDSPLPPRQIEP